MNPIKTGADIQALVDNAVPESRFLEFKRDLPDASRESKKEFTKDVSAFANEFGGVMIFGIEEDNAIPVKITGVPTATLDQDQTRLNQILADGIVPRIFGLDIFPVHFDLPLRVGVEPRLDAPSRAFPFQSSVIILIAGARRRNTRPPAGRRR